MPSAQVGRHLLVGCLVSAAEAPSITDTLAACGLYTLPEDPPADTLEGPLTLLREAVRGMDPTRRALAEVEAVRELKERKVHGAAGVVRAFLKGADAAAEDALQGRAVTFAEVEPWPEPVDGSAMLGEVVRTVTRYVTMPEGSPTAVALWIVYTYCFQAWHLSPMLNITSPEKRCGKSTLLNIIRYSAFRALKVGQTTPAALFRVVEKYTPTLVLDEADRWMNENPQLIGIINSGHTRSDQILRIVGDDHEARMFSPFCPKAVGGIGSRDATIADRSIAIPMQRQGKGEKADRLRYDLMEKGELIPLQRKVLRWATDHAEDLAEIDPAVPEALHDRAADNWRPLLAIADCAGGQWPERARRAAVVLSAAGNEDDEASGAPR